MIYLDPSEYEAHGLEATTPASWVAAASALIDAHCRRPSLGVTEYKERLRLAPGRNTVRLTYLPLATIAPAESPLTEVRVRYGVPRRGTGMDNIVSDVAQVFTLTVSWTTLDFSTVDFDAVTGDLTLPCHPLGIGFNEIQVTYTAGVEQTTAPLRFACAQIVRNALATPALTVRANSLDRIHFEYFADSLLDQDVRKSLAPYVAQKLI
jgi:hypothetical protein